MYDLNQNILTLECKNSKLIIFIFDQFIIFLFFQVYFTDVIPKINVAFLVYIEGFVITMVHADIGIVKKKVFCAYEKI